MILVTGSTGLLGSHLLLELTSSGSNVRALYRNDSRKTRVRQLFEFYAGKNSEIYFQRIEWFRGDILDISGLEEAMQGVEKVYHCAGYVTFNSKRLNTLMKINREGTANVVNTSLSAGVSKLCYVSSTAAIGASGEELVNENAKWKQSPFTSAYAISKYSAEKEIWRGVEEGLNAVIVNPSVIFGAGNWNESSMTIFRTVDNGLAFYTGGANGFVDARDVSRIMVLLTESDIVNERFLIVGTNCSFLELTTRIAEHIGKKPPHINTPRWLMGLAWRISGLSARITGNEPTITRESVRSAFTRTSYDNSKIVRALDYSFIPLNETIENAVKGRVR